MPKTEVDVTTSTKQSVSSFISNFKPVFQDVQRKTKSNFNSVEANLNALERAFRDNTINAREFSQIKGIGIETDSLVQYLKRDSDRLEYTLKQDSPAAFKELERIERQFNE